MLGGFKTFGRVRENLAVTGQDPVNGGPRQDESVVVGQVPAEGLHPGVQAGLGQPGS